MYSAISGEAMAFHASSMTRHLRFFFRRIFCRNTSMMMSVNDGEELLVLLDGIHLEDDEGLVEQGAIHVLVENLVVLAATVEVLEHIGEVVAVDGGDVVLDADLVETLTGELIE